MSTKTPTRKDSVQLPLRLPHEPAMAADDFLLGDCNRQAFEFITSWPRWPSPFALLTGPPGSGKSHLASIWMEQTGAQLLASPAIATASADAINPSACLCIEDLVPGEIDQRSLFHIFNLVRSAGGFLLLTSAEPLARWTVTLPDLLSRLRAATPVRLTEPDEDLFRRLLVKLLADRMISIDQRVLDFLVLRAERSYAAASGLVERLDEASLSHKRPITRPIAAEVMAHFERSTSEPS